MSQRKLRAKITHSQNKGQIDWLSIVTTANNFLKTEKED
jgi:hypothetical protein